ncbi:MAG TPA: Na+/H+ antiporter NhaA [Actinomycetes bacterium]|nr:Na+/H+ antiporter NhaA [Actinomycetes bacterium]
MPTPGQRRVLFGRLPIRERTFIADALRQETVGGALLLIAAVVGLVLANSAWSGAYEDLKHYVVGPDVLQLNLTLEEWAADGLLAIFFFVAGLELKRELVVGTLREPSQAVLPVFAALGGMIMPALIFLVITAGDDQAQAGWAIPMATDIAFALAVLAVVGSHLPPALRAFLLTLAVVDDLGAITVIAVLFTDDLSVVPLLIAVALMACYLLLQRARITAWWMYVPLAVTTWAMMQASGVHATVAGVVLGLLTRARADDGEDQAPAERLEHRMRPISAGVAVPVFAFLSAGVAFSISELTNSTERSLLIGVIVGLVVGKLVGVFGATWLTARFTRAQLDPSLRWIDMVGLSLVAGIGFTVALLMAELAFAGDADRLSTAKTGVLMGSLVSAALATIILRSRDRSYRLSEQMSEARPDGVSET